MASNSVAEPAALAQLGGQDREIIEGLLAVYDDVTAALADGPPKRRAKGGQTNPKGDEQKWFDLVADETILRTLEEHFGSGEVLSEERAKPKRFGTTEPRLRFVIDPVDGSTNYGRGVPLAGVAVAVMRADAQLGCQSVTHAMVGPLELGGCPLYAIRGGGAYRVLSDGDHERLRTTKQTELEESILSFEQGRKRRLDAAEQAIYNQTKSQRMFGASTRAISMIAEKAVDLHIDIRGSLTPENFLAPALIVTESGGYACTDDGKTIGPFRALTDRASIVVAASKQLALRTVAEIKEARGS